MQERPSLSRRIAADLREAILSGDLPQGAVLPSERELIERYDTTKSTASKAVAILQAEGLVTTEFGRGTFVRSRPPLRRVSAAQRHAAHRSAGKPVFDVQAIEQGQQPSRKMLYVGRGQATTSSAMWLQIDPDEEVAIRRRLQLLDGKPAVISTSYYPLWMAAGTRLESPEPLPARMPTPDEVALLNLGQGVPVVEVWHVDYNVEGQTLQVAHDIFAGDQHEFAYEWTEEGIGQ